MIDPKMVEVIEVYFQGTEPEESVKLAQRLHDAGYRMAPSVDAIEACMEAVPFKVHPDEPDVQYRELRDFSLAIHDLMMKGGE